ncbi:MAG: protein adenylyltransferase SelO [Microcella sp.]
MTASTAATIALEGRFARELPELAAPWQAEEPPAPHLLALNEPLATILGLDPDFLRSANGIAFLTGASLPDTATPVAQAYSGHQFGGFSPRLGDGRALLLGELRDPDGNTHDLHLKGSGPTPFARAGDGRAVVGPMLREFVISEAMHALGIPTTRSLAVVATGRPVQRETLLPGAVLARTASSHLRVGSFQFAAATGDRELLRRLADHAIDRHYPDAASAEHPYLALFEAVVAAQANLVAQWMLVGFVHGVMNTDNMTISGETIDYGPCAFVDAFDHAAVFSSIDQGGRYAYGNQPVIAEWNLARFAETLLPLIDDDADRAVERATGALGEYRAHYSAAWISGMRMKLGLAATVTDEAVAPLATELLNLLHENRVDFTSFFRALAGVARGGDRPAVLEVEALGEWAGRWLELSPDAGVMDRVNPVYIPRNHLVEEALAVATAGDMGPFDALVEVIRRPFDERPGLERYAAGAPDGSGPYTTFCGT